MTENENRLDRVLRDWAEEQKKASPSVSFTDNVMDRIHSDRKRRLLVLNPVPAFASVAAILIIGFLVGYLVRPADTNGSPDEVLVTFSLSAPDAGNVSLAGNFTGWEPIAMAIEDGVWQVQVKLKKGNAYTYNFVIDSETWIPDPNGFTRIQDGFGSESTFLKL